MTASAAPAKTAGRRALEAGLRQGILKAGDVALSPQPDDEDDYQSPFTLETDDNGDMLVSVTAPPRKEATAAGAFDENLAELMDEAFLTQLGQELCELIEDDISAREDRDKQQAEGMQRCGIGQDAPGGANFNGASRATHPVMAEAGIDFATKAMKELFPPNGPVKTKIEGPSNDKKIAKARRKAMHMNWQFTKEIEEYRRTLRVCLSQVPYGGSQYLLAWYDRNKGRVRVDFVPVDMVYLPYAASSPYSAERITHRQDIVEAEFERRVQSGLYRRIDPMASSMPPDPTQSAEVAAKVEGKERPVENEDGERTMFHTFCMWDMDGLDERALEGTRPYQVMLDRDSKQVLGIYRNWDEDDPKQNPVDNLIQFDFIVWRGALGIGLPQIVGGLSVALTGALRALMDSALIANQMTMVKLPGNKMGGQSKSGEQQQIIELDAKALSDDIRKLAFQLETHGPSQTLFALLGWLDGAARGLISTAEEKIADATGQGPVGTVQSLIEAGSKVFSDIFAGLHASQCRLFQAVHRLNRLYMNERVILREFGDLVVYRADYETPFDVRPVSDPNIFSESQRLAQSQGILQLSVAHPAVMRERTAVEGILDAMRVDDPERYLQPKPPEANWADPAAENMLMSTGLPVKAYPGQDHLAHLAGHIAYLLDPALGFSPFIAPVFLPAARDHIRETIALLYHDTMQAVAAMHANLAPEHAQAIAIAIVHKHLDQQLNGMPQIMEAVDQAIKQLLPPQPMDPSAAALKAATQETERRAQKDRSDTAVAVEKIQVDLKRILADMKKAADANATKLTVAAMRERTQRMRPAGGSRFIQ